MTTGSQRLDEGNKRDEPSPSRGRIAGAYLFGMITRLQAAIMDRMPLGYEDEVGFHVGAKSSRGERRVGILAENQTKQPQDDYPPGRRSK
jgi:hypothetical protein